MDVLKLDLINVMYAYGVFGLAFTANVLFSLYFNIKVKREMFSWFIFIDSLKKALVFIVATLALVVSVDMAMLYFNAYVPELSEDTQSLVTILMIVSTIGRASLKYIVEAYGTFTNILNGTINENMKSLVHKE